MLALFSVVMGGPSPCQDEECSLNGISVAAADGSCECECVPEWTGDDCGQLNLLPAPPRGLGGFDEAGNSSWGGSIIQDPDDSGLWHMFLSRMAGHCGLNSWKSNSELVRATATSPLGPFVYAETVLPYFAHGPTVRKLPDGQGFYMMHLGCGYPFQEYNTNCSNGTSNSVPPNVDTGCTQFNVSVRTSPSLLGPWSEGTQVYLSSGDAGDDSWFVTSGRCGSTGRTRV